MLLSALITLMLVGQSPGLTVENVDRVLEELHGREPGYHERLVALAKLTLGTPYGDGPLGEGPGAKHDPDPIVDLGRVDCVTYVEQILALAAEDTYAAAVDVLQQIRYHNGAIDYGTRNHFFIADWIRNNTFARDVTGSLNVACVQETRTIGRRKFFELTKAPEYLADAHDEPLTLSYVAVSTASQVEPAIPSPALIVFIGKPTWLFASHCGFFIRENGQGLLYHASSVGNEVVAVPFDEYLNTNSKIVGFTVYTIDSEHMLSAE
jgi:hypothetical protein